MTSRSRIVFAVHRFVLRTARTPLQRLWVLAYRIVARAACTYLAWGNEGAAAYARGGVAADDFLPGLSDVDAAVVLADDPAGPGIADRRARQRWARLGRVLPLVELLVDRPLVYEEPALRHLVGSSPFTHGLAMAPAPGADDHGAYRGVHATRDWVRALERPGLYRPEVGDWRSLWGPDRRPPGRAWDAQDHRISAWLELVFWWRFVFAVCVDPSGPRTAALCVKLIAEPTRIWLWLAYGARVATRRDALCAGLRVMPEEETALQSALDLHESLHTSPDPPLAELLPSTVRISARIADLLSAEVRDDGVTEVRLAGAGPVAGEPERLPLGDWRALACPVRPDESLALLPGEPGDPAALATAISDSADAYTALRAGNLMVLPASTLLLTRLRAIKCPVVDPVPFAVAAGEPLALFPRVRGWSAEDSARRAVAEHAAWLRSGPRRDGGADSDGESLGTLLTAARAGLFLESIAEGTPELSLTTTETVRRLAARPGASRAVAEEALGHYGDFAAEGEQPPVAAVAAMRELVLELPSYLSVTPGP